MTAFDELSDIEFASLVKSEAFGDSTEEFRSWLREHPQRWHKSMSDMATDINAQIVHRKSDIMSEYRTAVEWNTYHSWRAGALSVKGKLEIRLKEAKLLIRAANVAESDASALRRLRDLRRAVLEHRVQITGDGSARPADTLLWDHLDDLLGGGG